MKWFEREQHKCKYYQCIADCFNGLSQIEKSFVANFIKFASIPIGTSAKSRLRIEKLRRENKIPTAEKYFKMCVDQSARDRLFTFLVFGRGQSAISQQILSTMASDGFFQMWRQLDEMVST